MNNSPSNIILGRSIKSGVFRFIFSLPVVLWSSFTVFGIGWILVTSLKTNRQLFANVWSLPTVLQFQNYIKAWRVVHMDQYFINSVIVVGLSVLFVLIVSAPISYVLTRIPFRGSNSLTMLFTAGMAVPEPLLFIPLFGLLASFNWIDTRQGLILIYVCLSIPFTVFLLTGFFGSIPIDLEEAAALDGANSFHTFLKVIIPLASPGLLTAAIFNFIGLWNEFMLALIFITSHEKRTISLGLYAMQDSMQFSGDWVGLFAGVILVMIPTALLFVVISDRMISGITLGAVK